MVRKKRQFDGEFKANAVKLVLTELKTVAQVARELDIVPSVLSYWVKKAKVEAAPAGSGELKAAEREELASLRKQVKQLEMERAFLKKAAAYFAKENP
jgi:transposase